MTEKTASQQTTHPVQYPDYSTDTLDSSSSGKMTGKDAPSPPLPLPHLPSTPTTPSAPSASTGQRPRPRRELDRETDRLRFLPSSPDRTCPYSGSGSGSGSGSYCQDKSGKTRQNEDECENNQGSNRPFAATPAVKYHSNSMHSPLHCSF